MSDSDPSADLATRFAFEGAAGAVLRDHYLWDRDQAELSAKFKLYYRFRRFIPIPVRQLLQKQRNQGMETPQDWYLPTRFLSDFRTAVDAEPDRLQIHPWPDRFEFAASLTHDVETEVGMGLIDQLAAVEEEFGFRSSWNVIPHKYKVDTGLLDDLVQRGHEIGVHGYNHDGRLFESRRIFRKRTAAINQAVADFGSVGFRAPMVHRDLAWMQSLRIEYDASCFDVDPFQAMPGGVGGVWPFIAGDFVELPYTLPQDHTLLVSLGETTPQIWIQKLSLLRALSGMAMLITHPDYLDTPQKMDVYRAFLEHLAEQQDGWFALPREIADWWRQRDQLNIDDSIAPGKIVGSGADRARLITLQDLPVIQGEAVTA